MKLIKRMSMLFVVFAMVMTIGIITKTDTNAAIKVYTGKKATISIGESYGIATKSKGVSYKSSNKKVAKVSKKGIVKGRKAGTCKITLSGAGGKATVKITVTPAKVKSVKATVLPSDKAARVTWKKVKGASGYIVYRSTKKNKGYKAVKTIKKRSTVKTTISGLAGGKTYYFKVKAYTNVGKKKRKKKIKSASYSAAAKVKTWGLVWSDEFNGTSLDMNNWTYETGNGVKGWGNGEYQSYTAGDNIKFENGNLVIIPRMKVDTATGKQSSWTSTRFKSKGKREFKYGKIEIRAKASKAEGTWSAGWMLGANSDVKTWPACGEIDIMEAMNAGVPQSIHCPYFNNQSWSHGNKNYETGLTQAAAASAYHTYGIIWTDKSISFTVDGRVTGVYDPSKYSASIRKDTWVFDHEFFFIFNCAIGGNASGYYDGKLIPTKGWTLKSNVNGIQTYEDYFYIDYVRVFQ